MSEQEARSLLRECVDRYRRRPRGELLQACEEGPTTVDVAGRSGAHYAIVVRVICNDPIGRDGPIRVIATIGDDHRALSALRDEFTLAP